MADSQPTGSTGCRGTSGRRDLSATSGIRAAGIHSTHGHDSVFDQLAAVAAQLSGTSCAVVTVVVAGAEEFLAGSGAAWSERDTDVTWPGLLLQDQTFESSEMRDDPRFAAHPLIARHGFRFLAAVPLPGSDGRPIGTLAVLDQRVRQLTATQRGQLVLLARQLAGELQVGGHPAAVHGATSGDGTASRSDTTSRNGAEGTGTTTESRLRTSELRWRQLFDESPVGIGLSDERGLFVAANPALCALYGRTEADVIGHSSAEFTHPDDLESHRQATVLLNSADDGIVRIEKRYLRPDGSHRWAWLTVTHTPGPNGQVWTLAHVQDVTDRLAGEQAIRDSEANLSAVATVVQHIQTGADARQTVVDACMELAGAARVSLYEPDTDGRDLEVTATNRADELGSRLPFDPDDLRWRAFRGGTVIAVPPANDGTRSAAHPDGSGESGTGHSGGDRAGYLVPVTSRQTVTALLAVEWLVPAPAPTDRRALVITMLADQAGVALSQRALLNELEVLAHTDQLTGLPNRRSWERRLTDLLSSAQRTGRQPVIALIDLDHFKLFNDTHGHAAGDALLRDFAVRSRSVLKAGDILARWGGEEFALALGDCAEDDILPVLARVKGAVPDGETCSIGWALTDATESVDHLMVRVDTALYAAKRAGRNRIERAD